MKVTEKRFKISESITRIISFHIENRERRYKTTESPCRKLPTSREALNQMGEHDFQLLARRILLLVIRKTEMMVLIQRRRFTEHFTYDAKIIFQVIIQTAAFFRCK